MPNPPSAVPGAGWAHGAGVCDCCPSAPLDDDDAWDELASAVAAVASSEPPRARAPPVAPPPAPLPEGEVLPVAGDQGGTTGAEDAPPGFTPGRARFNHISGLALLLARDGDDDGPEGLSLIVADAWNHRIRRVALGSRRDERDAVATLAGGGGRSAKGFVDCGAGDAAAAARFSRPRDVCVDERARGRVLVADSENHAVRALDADGAVRTLVGGGGGARDGDHAPPPRFPSAVCASERWCYAAERWKGTVVRFALDGGAAAATAPELETVADGLVEPEALARAPPPLARAGGGGDDDVLLVADARRVWRVSAARGAGPEPLFDLERGSARALAVADDGTTFVALRSQIEGSTSRIDVWHPPGVASASTSWRATVARPLLRHIAPPRALALDDVRGRLYFADKTCVRALVVATSRERRARRRMPLARARALAQAQRLQFDGGGDARFAGVLRLLLLRCPPDLFRSVLRFV